MAGKSARSFAAIRRGRISFVFQSFNLVDEMTVRDNVQLALRYGELSRKRSVSAWPKFSSAWRSLIAPIIIPAS